MSETLVWLAYCVSAVLAFLAVYLKGWRITAAMIAGAAVGLALSMLATIAVPPEDPNPWIQVELAMNGSLSLIFAGAGAALGFAARSRKE